MPSTRSVAIGALCLASSAMARTDLEGCTYTDLVIKPTQMAPYASRLYYVPDSGEVCAFLDCGGGRAPPKTTVPGCPQYSGTETYSPSFIDLDTLGQIPATNSPASSPSSNPATATAAGATTTTMASVVSTSAEAATPSAESSESGSNSAKATETPSGSDSGSAAASGESTKTTAGASSSTGAAAALPTAGAMLGSYLVAGVAAGFGLL